MNTTATPAREPRGGSARVPRPRRSASAIALGGLLLCSGCSQGSGHGGGSTAAPLAASGVPLALPEARAEHTAVLLPTGEVFVAGGVDAAGRPLDSTVLVGRSQVRSGPRLSAARTGHTATLLPGGVVLLAGGFGDASRTRLLDSTELYDSLTDTVAAGPRLAEPRAEHVALDLAGGGQQVLIATGVTQAGGGSAPVLAASAEVLDLAAGRSTPLAGGPSQARRRARIARLVGGDLLIVSGEGAGGPPGAEVFSPAQGRFRAIGGAARAGAAVAGHGSDVLVAGGESASGLEDASEVWDGRANALLAGPRLSSARRDASVASLSSAMLLIGGRNAAGALSLVERLEGPDLARATLTGLSPLGTARYAHSTTVIDGPAGERVLVLGGYDASGVPTASIEVLDPSPSLPTAAGSQGATPLTGAAPVASAQASAAPTQRLAGSAASATNGQTAGPAATAQTAGASSLQTASAASAGGAAATPQSWTQPLDQAANANGGILGLAAIQKAQALGATKQAINAYLTQKDYKVGPAAAAQGFGPTATWLQVLDEAVRRNRGNVVGLDACQAAVRLGASQPAVNAFLAGRGYKVGAAAAAAGFGPKP